jgi:hypothetical protein
MVKVIRTERLWWALQRTPQGWTAAYGGPSFYAALTAALALRK